LTKYEHCISSRHFSPSKRSRL